MKHNAQRDQETKDFQTKNLPQKSEDCDPNTSPDRRRFLKAGAALLAAGSAAAYSIPKVVFAQVEDMLSPPPEHCNVNAFAVPENRSGCKNVQHDGLKDCSESFDMNADFQQPCGICEYRQYVRGQFRVNGWPWPHWLPGGWLMVDRFREDGIYKPPPGVNVHYGHRNEPYNPVGDCYQNPPGRANGCEYRGLDEPGLYNFPLNNILTVDLTFRGEIICTNCGGIVIANEWNVLCFC